MLISPSSSPDARRHRARPSLRLPLSPTGTACPSRRRISQRRSPTCAAAHLPRSCHLAPPCLAALRRRASPPPSCSSAATPRRAAIPRITVSFTRRPSHIPGRNPGAPRPATLLRELGKTPAAAAPPPCTEVTSASTVGPSAAAHLLQRRPPAPPRRFLLLLLLRPGDPAPPRRLCCY